MTFQKGNQSPLKNKTYEEVFGIEKALQIKQKLRDKKYGENNPAKKLGVGLKISIAKKGKPSKLKGRNIPENIRNKIRQTLIGHTHLQETIQKISQTKKGCKLSEEHKEKIRLGNLGKKHTMETIQKLRNISKGKNPWNNFKNIDNVKKKLSNLMKSNKNPMKNPEVIKKMSGENSSLWLGGKSFEPYTVDFNKQFKESIRERDNYCCLLCNIPQESLGYKLCIHHVDYTKNNSFPQNCASLCRNCHIPTNYNREIWTKHFQELLKKLYGYEYTQDQKIILDFTDVKLEDNKNQEAKTNENK